jgi:hypothetical protein
MRYLARIDPQAWVHDYAMSVDPPGETTWDCTDFIAKLPNWCKNATREKIDQGIQLRGYFLDRDDVVAADPAAPAWVRGWSGPFTITIEPA